MKIGLLLPRSVLYPSIAFDMLDGLKAGLRTRQITDTEIVTANIGLAARNEEIYRACEELLIGGARTVVAYMNPASAEFVHPLFQHSDSLLLLLDSGYQFPSSPDLRLSHVFSLSLQGALCCRVSGRLAAEAGYRDFAFVGSFYDAGYRSGYTFANSVADRGGEIRFNHITALRRADFTLAPLTEHIRKNENNAVLASFCGDMAEDFLGEAGRQELVAGGKVFGSPFMAEELWLGKIPYPGHDWTCATSWARSLDTEENRRFVSETENIRTGKANVFSLLTWEAALLIAQMRQTGETAENLFAEGGTLQSPRGTLHIAAGSREAEAPVYSVTVGKDEASGHCRITEIRDIPYLEEERERYRNDIRSLTSISNNWLNAYACLDS